MRLLASIGLLWLALPAMGAPAITVPAGTKVPLRLTSPLATKTARPGDAVHAEAAFPVTAGDMVAIPPGTYLEGVIDKVTMRGRHAGFTMHFTRMVYNNGYTVPLSEANADTHRAGLPAGAETRAGSATGYTGAMAFQSPTLMAPPRPGPNPAAIAGVAVGGTAPS